MNTVFKNDGDRVVWFFVGMGLVWLLSTVAPKIAGWIVVLIALYLGFQLARKGLV